MVALAIFSLAAMALLRLQIFTTSSGGRVIGHEMLWQLARNHEADILSDPAPLTFGTVSGEETNGGQTYQWTRVAKRTDDPELARIDIRISNASGQKAELTFARRIKQWPE